MESNKDFMKSWSEIPFSPYNGKGFTLYNGINQIRKIVENEVKWTRYLHFPTIILINDASKKILNNHVIIVMIISLLNISIVEKSIYAELFYIYQFAETP
jgi:hypothetical protein